MKKLLTATILASALALTLGISACSAGEKAPSGGKFDDLTTAESVYGFSAASAGMLISAMDGGKASASVKSFASSAAENAPEGETPAETPGTSDDLSRLDGYMALVESLVSDGGFGVDVASSDREGYTEKMTVSYRDMDGASHQYTMYYNRIAVPDDDDDDDWDDRFDDEQEENYALEGVLSVEGTDYAVYGIQSSESEGGESESETEFRVTLGENRYMYVEQSSERENGENEQEYEYTVRENGQVVERSTFSYETERGETELKMTSYKDGASETFYFERETYRGQEVVFVRIGNGQSSQGYIVDTVTDENGTRYEYTPVSRR